jgi:hypothetical protein
MPEPKMENIFSNKDPQYRAGFQDALELCLAETANAKDKTEAYNKLQQYLGQFLEFKVVLLKGMLCT